jgi:hypothetical protein
MKKLLPFLLLITACQPGPGPVATPTLAATFTPLATETPAPPTATPEPLAATVNGQPIPLAAYQAERARCEAGVGEAAGDPGECPALVLQGLIEEAVVEQAATQAGLSVTEEEVEAELAVIQAGLGDPDAFARWLQDNGYTADNFKVALGRGMLRARMLTQVTAAVGTTAEQVRASLILVADEASARALRAELEAGADFAILARNNSLDPSSRLLGGDLDWFVRGQLTLPEVEAAAFALEPGQLSDVIPTALGYALVRVEARDPARLLTNDQPGIVRQHAVDVWLQGALAGAVIETFVTP